MIIFSNGRDVILEQDEVDSDHHMVTRYINLSEHLREIVRAELAKGVALKAAEPMPFDLSQILGVSK
jgi:hypothetical protein